MVAMRLNNPKADDAWWVLRKAQAGIQHHVQFINKEPQITKITQQAIATAEAVVKAGAPVVLPKMEAEESFLGKQIGCFDQCFGLQIGQLCICVGD